MSPADLTAREQHLIGLHDADPALETCEWCNGPEDDDPRANGHIAVLVTQHVLNAALARVETATTTYLKAVRGGADEETVLRRRADLAAANAAADDARRAYVDAVTDAL